MRAVRARIFALLAALLMLLPGGAWARTQFYCPMMGHIVASCCDETDALSQAPSAAPQLRVADCCQRLSSSNQGASLGTHEAFQEVAAAALPSTRPPSFGLSPREGDTGSSCAEATQAPLAIGPPLFVAHCALLT
jgi:hypothetical protein